MSQTATMPALPDVNRETHPFPVVLNMLDETANYCFFAVPDPGFSETASVTPNQPGDFFGINGGYGIHFRSRLHGFDSHMESAGIHVSATTGSPVGWFTCRCLFGPDDFPWAPGGEPEPRIYDPYRSRRFAMVDVEFDFGRGELCRAYGVGRTYPTTVHGSPLVMAGGVGNVTWGEGRFAGLEGTFVMTGFFTPELGFRGNITLRIVDPRSRLRSENELDPLSGSAEPSKGSSFYIFRGEKKDRYVKTTFGPPRGDELSLITPSQMRSVEFACHNHGSRGLQTSMSARTLAGTMSATVYFNLLAPPGTAERTVPFETEEIYTFLRHDGREVGTVLAGVEEGISFDLKFKDAPDQPGVRFSGFGRITGGTGPFEGVQGMLTVNSLIGIAPHTLSLIHVLHIIDPDGRFRSRQSRFL